MADPIEKDAAGDQVDFESAATDVLLPTEEIPFQPGSPRDSQAVEVELESALESALKSATAVPLVHELALLKSTAPERLTSQLQPDSFRTPKLLLARTGEPLRIYPAWLLRILCVAVSIAVGLISFLWFFALMDLKLIPSCVIGGVTCLFLLVFLNLGSRFQCVGALVGPLMGTNYGRTVVLILASATLLAGPVTNILHNANEVTKSFSCISDAVSNETEEIKNLMSKPYEILNRQILESVGTWKDTSTQFTSKFQSVNKQVDRIQQGTSELIRTVKHYKQVCDTSIGDLQGTCRAKVNTVKLQCNQMIETIVKSIPGGQVIDTIKDTAGGAVSGLENKIKDTWNSISGKNPRSKRGVEQLCDVMKVEGLCQGLPTTNLCESGSVGEMVQKIDDVSTSVGYSMSEMDKMLAFKVTKLDGVQSQLESTPEETVGSFNLSRTASLTGKSENIKKKITAIVITIMVLKITLSCSAIALLVNGWLYLSNYLVSNDYDNNFISKDLVDLDARLAQEDDEGDQNSIFPLTRVEERSYQDLRQTQLSSDEKKDVYVALLVVGGNVIVAGFLFAFDDLLGWVMDFLKEFSGAFSFTEFLDQQRLKFTIEGGFMAGFIQKFINGFTDFYQGSSMSDLGKCLSDPSHLEWKFYIVTGVLYLITVALTLAQPYCRRYLHVVADIFYPERKEARLLHLIEKIQLDRLRDGTQLNIKRTVEGNLLETERKEKLKQLNRLQKIKKSYRRELYRFGCLVCSSKMVPGHLDTVLCLTPGCKGLYCRSCLERILQGICPLCERNTTGRSVDNLNELEYTKEIDN